LTQITRKRRVGRPKGEKDGPFIEKIKREKSSRDRERGTPI